ncbi:MAG: rod shape-determining protein MreB [Thermodesulfobacteriota bacterium]
MHTIRCPKCRTRFPVDAAKIPARGIYARCGRCRHRFLLKLKSASLNPAPAPRRRVTCDNCDRRIGKLENLYRFNGHSVCFECHTRLAALKAPPPAAPTPPPEKKTEGHPDSNGKRTFPFSLRHGLLGLFSNDLAIDLGTANTLVYIRRKGIVLNEASVVAFRVDAQNGKRILAVGRDAKRMMGRTPDNVKAIRPMRDGVIADFEVAGAMLREFIQKVRKKRGYFFRPRMIIAVPSGITQVEKRAVKESAEKAGAREVFLIEEPMAAAIGADLPVTEPTCNMVVDIGGGTTEVAVISLSGIVSSKSVKVAGDEMDDAIIRYIKKKYNFIIGERTAEIIKIRIGNARPDERHPEKIEVKGWEVVTGRPRIFTVTALEIREAIADQLQAILEAIKLVLDKTPQELTAGVIDTGIVLTGGGALLKNLDVYLAEQSGLPVKVADDPLATIVIGSGKTFEDAHLFRQVLNP